ncbi:MAG TPA: ABC transporter ATP-binding protein [Trueperaceae bacterium]|nr:ABC transporter ATP-binding protein [Trueperaceae bacterium]
MNAITATGLTKRYGAKAAVADATFTIEQGEIVGFLGPNGAGKTTTLRMLAGLVRPTEGSCTVLGQPVPGATLREVGTMIEEPSFYPYMTGRSNLRHAALLHGDVPPSRVDEVLEFVSLQDAADKKVRAYSQGMRQRLALARALLWRPKVMLLDEPTNGLDPTGIAEVRESLRSVASEGVTVLVSSHILAEIEKLVDRILAIDAGRIVFDGPLRELVERMGAPTVTYTVTARDQAGLLAALAELGYTPAPRNQDGADVTVPADEADLLIERLTSKGVRVTSATLRGEDLEGAYLRLIDPHRRPS